MNFDTLDFLIKNRIELLEDAARDTSVNLDATVGIAKKVEAERTITNLSPAQLYVFERTVKPLINEVRCNGQCNELEENPHCNSLISNEILTSYYESESCQSLSDGQQHTRSRIMAE
ncbi:hypothetical protein ABF236_000839 [Yersinia ruckeri]